MLSCSKCSSQLCGCPYVKTGHTSSWLEYSKLGQVRSKLVQVRSKLGLELVRSKQVLERGSKQEPVLVRSKLVLVHSNRSLPYGIRTSQLRWLVRT